MCRSSADPKIGSELVKHYSKPYFIPPQPETEEPRTSWIFMGSPGPGAFMHVRRRDWRSIRGRTAAIKGTTLDNKLK